MKTFQVFDIVIENRKEVGQAVEMDTQSAEILVADRYVAALTEDSPMKVITINGIRYVREAPPVQHEG
jgi:hypothetical protein